MRLKNILENVIWNPKAGGTFEMIKKELRNMKVAENCEVPFEENHKTFYTRNEDNRRSYNKK